MAPPEIRMFLRTNSTYNPRYDVQPPDPSPKRPVTKARMAMWRRDNIKSNRK